MNLGGHAPLEAGDEALLEFFNLAGRAVAGENDLFVAVVERVEGVEEFLLGAFLAGEELDVVDEQDIGLAVFFAEFHQRAVLDGIDELVRELLAGEVNDLCGGVVGLHMMADRLEEVGFSNAADAVDKEGIVGDGGRIADGERGGVGEFVVTTHDEILKGVARIHPGHGDFHRFVLRFLAGFAGGRGWGGLGFGLTGLELDFFDGRGDEEDGFPHDREVVALDKKLVDRIGHAQAERCAIDGGNRDIRKPSLKTIGAHALADVLGNLRPKIGWGVRHDGIYTPRPACRRWNGARIESGWTRNKFKNRAAVEFEL